MEVLKVFKNLLGILGIILSVIGFSLIVYSITDPEMEYYVLFQSIGGFLLITAFYPVFLFLKEKFHNHNKIGPLWLSFVVGAVFFVLSNVFTIFIHLEEASISTRFVLLRGNPLMEEATSEDGRIEFTKFDPPPRARHDIQIIGITTNSLEKLQGTWPLPWKVYADIIEKFSESNNVLMFDIFFVDYKEGQIQDMVKALEKNSNVFFDYPMETSMESKAYVLNLNKRLEILRKFKLKNVIDESRYDYSWVKFPQPPIEPIARLAKGLGYANVKKDDSGLNRKMPLVVKVPKSGPNGEDEYYPSIDLLLALDYYGVGLEDVFVEMGKSITIRNIPQTTITAFNPRTASIETKDIMAKPTHDRTIVIPIDWEGQMNINFSGGRYAFRSHEIFDVAVEWEKETVEQFQKNIFLVAMYYATGRGASKDSHLSPFGDMSGIEHHAHAINTILNQDFLYNSNETIRFILYLSIALFIGIIQPRLSTVFGFIFIIVFILIYFILTLVSFNEWNYIIPLPSILIEQIAIFVGIVGYKILTEEANVKYIRNTFSKFVSKDVVDELLKNPDNLALGGSKREITIFFSDIRGFTTISESLGPEELVQLLNEYLSAMTEIILEYKGTIDKYMGDAIMAFWGAPVPLEDHAYYACLACLAQLEYLKKLQEGWRKKGLPVIEIGMGLNSGPAVVGNMGSSHRMEYTCMGDTINLGSRLEGSNKMYGTNIIISEYTYEMVKDKIIARELDLVRVKGKNQPVRIYELIGVKDPEDFERRKRPLSELTQK